MTDPHSQFNASLQQFRHDIDAIDSELFQLILKRANIVKQVGELKDKNDQTHVKLRPAREARQLKSIYQKFEESPFPEASALMIWRHLINGSLMVESPLRVQTLAKPQALPDFAREYFGCYADLDYTTSCTELLAKLRSSEIDIGIFPMPAACDKEPWWLAMTEENNGLKVFLRFPYLPTSCVRDGTDAIAVSKIAEEAPNEDSHTALVLKIAASVNPVTVKNAVSSELGDVEWHCSNRLEDDSVACFITIPYLAGTTGVRMRKVLEMLGDSDSRIDVVGYYAPPLMRKL